jgi:hypothetical protein
VNSVIPEHLDADVLLHIRRKKPEYMPQTAYNYSCYDAGIALAHYNCRKSKRRKIRYARFIEDAID